MVEPVCLVQRNILIVLTSRTSQIFPSYADTERAPSKNSPLARIRAKRMEQREMAAAASLEDD